MVHGNVYPLGGGETRRTTVGERTFQTKTLRRRSQNWCERGSKHKKRVLTAIHSKKAAIFRRDPEGGLGGSGGGANRSEKFKKKGSRTQGSELVVEGKRKEREQERMCASFLILIMEFLHDVRK